MKKILLNLIIIIAIILPIYIVWHINEDFHKTILEAKEIEAVDIVSHMIHNMNQSKHIGHNHTKNRNIHLIHNSIDSYLKLTNPEFHKILDYNVSDLRINDATLVNMEGNVVYAVNGGTHYDFKNSKDFHQAIKTQKPVTKMIHVNGLLYAFFYNHKELDEDHHLDTESIVETYVPLLFRNSTGEVKVIGLIKIVFDISILNDKFDDITMKSLLILIGPMFIIVIMGYYSFERRNILIETKKSKKIIETISSLQDEFIISNEELESFNKILQTILKLTDCEFGFICGYYCNHLRSYALTDISWSLSIQDLYEKNKGYLEFRNMDTIFGEVIKSGRIIITNDPENHPAWNGKDIPEGHPKIKSFAGIPLYSHSGKIIGQLGLANRDMGFDAKFNKQIEYIIPTLTSIIELYQSKEESEKILKELKESEEKFRLVTQSTHDAIVGVDEFGNIIFWNPGAEKIFGYREEEILNSIFLSLLPETYIGGYSEICEKAIKVEDSFFIVDEKDIELYGQRRDGEEFPMQVTLTIWPFEKKNIYSAIIKDITERKKYQNKLVYQANYDKLTGIPNRNMLEDRIDRARTTAKRNKTKIAVMFVDLDRFKYVNDTFGHDAGDDLLQQVAKRLKSCVRGIDTVARIGGDEFLIILSDIEKPINIRKVAKKVLRQLVSKFDIKIGEEITHGVNISCSIGISIFPNDGYSKDELMKKADAAMYQAKTAGKNNYKFYTSELDDESSKKLMIEKELRTAMQNNEFYMVYQPIMCIEEDRIAGVETLLRWNNSNLGEVPPSVLIPIAEDIGMMPELGTWIFETSCAEINRVIDDERDIYLSINVSAAQLENPNFHKIINNIIKKTGFPAEMVQLEITESMIMKNIEKSIETMVSLTNTGVSIAIDDFGTGYSSLSYLKQIKASTLKIDKSFIDDVPDDADGVAIVKAIISMSQSLNLKLVAEGIENKKQVNFLKKLKCDRGQGYFYHKPMLISNLEKIII